LLPRLSVLLCLAAPASCAGADKLFHFVDEQGVHHYSNVPSDPRYRPLATSGVAQSGMPAPRSEAQVAPVTAVPLAPAPPLPGAVPLPPDEEEDER
jgi:hypothetical protein